LDRRLSKKHREYLKAFNGTRRMKRDVSKMGDLKDPLRTAVGLPLGDEGCFYVGSSNNSGQDKTEDVLDYNQHPSGQHSLWCPWMPSENGTEIEEDGSEKAYEYEEWLQYIVENFLEPWGYKLNGEVSWSGEDSDDRGTIYVKDNVVEGVPDVISNPGPSWLGEEEKLEKLKAALPLKDVEEEIADDVMGEEED